MFNAELNFPQRIWNSKWMNRCSQMKVLYLYSYSDHEVVGADRIKEDRDILQWLTSCLPFPLPLLISTDAPLPSATIAACHYADFPNLSVMVVIDRDLLLAHRHNWVSEGHVFSDAKGQSLFLFFSSQSWNLLSVIWERGLVNIQLCFFRLWFSKQRNWLYPGQKSFRNSVSLQFLPLWTFSLQITDFDPGC